MQDSYANTNTAHGQEDQLAQRIKDLEKTVADRDALIRSLEEKMYNFIIIIIYNFLLEFLL